MPRSERRGELTMTRPLWLAGSALACFVACSGSTQIGEGERDDGASRTPPADSPPDDPPDSPPDDPPDSPPATPRLPCDVLESAGNPCVAAHSTVRVLASDYAGS